MALPRRRKVEELVQRYRLNSNFGVDIYVEGRNDKQLIEMYLREKGVANTFVYSIASVEVSDGNLVSLGLNAGSCRSRVIALKELLVRSNAPLNDVRFVVDRDLEDLCSLGEMLSGIHLSDWGTLEMALVHDQALGRILGAFGCRDISVETFSGAVFSIAKSIYLIRSAAHRLALPLKILGPADFISVRGAAIDFDQSGYFERLLNASGLKRWTEDLELEIARCRDDLERQVLVKEITANDHDVLTIILKMIKIFGGLHNRSEDDVRALLLMAVDYSLLDSQVVFKRLVDKAE